MLTQSLERSQRVFGEDIDVLRFLKKPQGTARQMSASFGNHELRT
jgi:hypothetical protein